MKEWREYISENDGSWMLLKDKNETETIDDLKSKNGCQAVIVKRCEPADVVSIQILPAARVVDNVKKTIHHEKKFYIKLFSLKEEWSLISKECFLLDEVLKIAQRFLGLEKTQALKIWKVKKLGGEDNRLCL